MQGSQCEPALAKMTDILERERRRIAFDLHDRPTQTLSSALLQVEILEDLAGSAEAKRELAALKALLSNCLNEMRSLIHQLRPQALEAEGLAAKVRAYVEQFRARSGLRVDLQVTGEQRTIDGSLELAIFRVVQEALTNVQKHAGASCVEVSLELDPGEVRCRISDDGCGFAAEDVLTSANQDRFGLLSMRERLALVSGELKIDSASGMGTEIRFQVPTRRAA